MSFNNGLKVCTFNAKCDGFDYKCCIRDSCLENKCGAEFPDSLIAAMLAVTILPSKADIYNIQNVKNKCVVEHLIKEISRVKNITDKLADCYSCDTVDPAFVMDIACDLNSFEGLCADAAQLKDLLSECKICDMDYVNTALLNSTFCTAPGSGMNPNVLGVIFADVMKYTGICEYNAYYNGTCLTLVKKDLCIIPETKQAGSVDSLVLFFEYNGKRFIDVNVNLGTLVNSLEDIGCRKAKVDSLICFLKQYNDCGAVIMTGAFGDFDYDVSQLLFKGDGQLPELAQKLMSGKITENPVPSDFPCDLNDPVYEIMEFLLRTSHAEVIPYSWLLQYLRLKGCKKCCLYRLVTKDGSKCGKKCGQNNTVDDARKSKGQFNGGNRTQLRSAMKNSDKVACAPCNGDKKDKCNKPACVAAKKCCCELKCVKVCKDTCPVNYKQCDCDNSACEIKCKKNKDCDCDDSKYRVKVDTCKDLCEKKACCDSCAHGGKCEGDEVCPDNSCEGFKYCDPITTLKRDLCLFNTLNKVEDVTNRYTGFVDHFNRCSDCKFPRGVFQAWAQCKDYQFPCKKSRVIDNNSELLALDHFLVSDCLKNNITCVSLSDLCIEKCGTCVKQLMYDAQHPTMGGDYNRFNNIAKNPWKNATLNGNCPNNNGSNDFVFGNLVLASTKNEYVFEYGGSVVRSFFTNRVYCVNFDFPMKKKGCEVDCGETLHGLGLTGLWSVLCQIGCDCVDISVFQKFGLDQHPYFRDYFWKVIPRRTCTGPSCKSVLKKVNDFDCEPMALIQRNSSICEDDFYKHLLCVFSNVENRDGFILSISYMEALYRVCKLKCNFDRDDIRCILEDKDTIKQLLRSAADAFECDDDDITAREICRNPATTQCPNEDYGVDPVALGNLIDLLGNVLKDNCLYMEILCRHAARSLNLKADCNSTAGVNLSAFVMAQGAAVANDIVNTIMQQLNIQDQCAAQIVAKGLSALLCGANSRAVVNNIGNCIRNDDVVGILMQLINIDIRSIIIDYLTTQVSPPLTICQLSN